MAEVWRRRKWLGIVLFTMPAAALLSLAVNLPNLYSSTATLLVEQQQIPEGFVKSSVTGEADTRLNLIREKLLNRAGLMELITRFDLYSGLAKEGKRRSRGRPHAERRRAGVEGTAASGVRARRDIRLQSQLSRA